MLEGNEDLSHFLKGEHVFFPAKGTILHSCYIHCLFWFCTFSSQMHLKWICLLTTLIQQVCELFLQSMTLHESIAWKWKGEQLILYSLLCYWLLVSDLRSPLSLEAGLATEKTLDPVHPTYPTAGQWLCSVGKTDVIFRHACLMI